MFKLLSRLLLLLAIVSFLFAGYEVWIRYYPGNLDFSGPPVTSASVSGSLPVRLTYPDLHVKLPVIPQTPSGRNLPTTSKGITFLTSSPVPGSMGNSILYGHNWPVLLSPLKNARIGQSFTIGYADGSAQKFIVSRIQTVSPNDNSVLMATSSARITLYTCTGFFDTKRLVLTAENIDSVR